MTSRILIPDIALRLHQEILPLRHLPVLLKSFNSQTESHCLRQVSTSARQKKNKRVDRSADLFEAVSPEVENLLEDAGNQLPEDCPPGHRAGDMLTTLQFGELNMSSPTNQVLPYAK